MRTTPWTVHGLRAGPRPRLAPLLALAILGGAGNSPAQVPAGAGGEPPAAQRAVPAAPPALVRALRSLRSPDAPPIETLASEHAEAGRACIDALLEMLALRAVPELDGEPTQTLSEVQRELVLELLARAPREAVLAAVQRVTERAAASAEPISAPDSLGFDLAALDAWGAVGGLSELQGFFRIAERSYRVHGLAPVEPVLERALVRTLRRSAHTHEWLLAHWRDLEPELVPALLRAVGTVRATEGLELLARVLELRSPATPVALAQVRRIGPCEREEVNERLRWLLRPMLEPDRSDVCRAALLALGELRDVESIPRIVELLESEDRGLRDNALWALRRASGRPFPAQPALWRSWYQAESQWHAERFAAAREALSSPDAAVAAAALRELGAHRLRPEWIADAIAGALAHASPGIRALACRALAELGLPSCAAELRRALADPDAEVRAAAAAALARMGVAAENEGDAVVTGP